MPTCRELGHSSIVVQHLAFDRGAYSALARLCKQRMLQLALTYGGEGSGSEARPVMLNWQGWDRINPLRVAR
eukprot:5958408-Lingulodinium_polyedra.AAC.1